MYSIYQICVFVGILIGALPSSSLQAFVLQTDRRVGYRCSYGSSVPLNTPRHKECHSTRPLTLHMTGYSDNIEEDSSGDTSEIRAKETRNPPLTPPQQRPKLDPLFLAVTKMDPQTGRARSVEVPIWGELILDRSLFVLLPIFVFAVGGVLLSVYVLLNSGDTFVDAIVENSFQQSIPPSASSMNDEGCRGLCSSQAQDLEGLRSFMQRLGGR
jgi:hypothetical protein